MKLLSPQGGRLPNALLYPEKVPAVLESSLSVFNAGSLCVESSRHGPCSQLANIMVVPVHSFVAETGEVSPKRCWMMMDEWMDQSKL